MSKEVKTVPTVINPTNIYYGKVAVGKYLRLPDQQGVLITYPDGRTGIVESEMEAEKALSDPLTNLFAMKAILGGHRAVAENQDQLPRVIRGGNPKGA